MRRGKFQGMIWPQTPTYVCQLRMIGARGDATHGLLADVVECVGGGVNDLALDLVCPSTVVSQATGAGGNVNVPGHAESLSVVESLN
jgi:hypothetical protein